MRNDEAPSFRTLDRAEAEAILSRNCVGRIAYTFHDRVEIEPIHYAYEDGWIYGRTSPGAKVQTLTHHRWAAFEVDEVDGPFDWRSVVVHGTVYLLPSDSPQTSEQEFARGLALLRKYLPEAFTEHDPTPFRTVMFRLSMSEITARSASTQHPQTAGESAAQLTGSAQPRRPT